MTNLLQLFNNQLYKDIDSDFVDSLEAILYLNPLKNNELYESNKVKFKVDNYNTEVNYTVLDMLNTKLIDNFRRIYAVNNPLNNTKLHINASVSSINQVLNNATPSSKNTNKKIGINELLEQQNCIYKVFELLKDNIQISPVNFDPLIKREMTTRKYYKKSVLGQDADVSTVEIFCYLALHESLNENNRKIHNDILNIYMNQYSLSDNFITQYLRKIIRKPATNGSFDMMLENIINHDHKTDLLEMIDSNNNHTWTLGIIDHFMNHAENILNKNDKLIIIKTILKEGLYDNKYYNNFVSNPEKLKNVINNMIVQDHLQPEVMNLIGEISRPENFDATTLPVFMKVINQLTSPQLFVKTLLSSSISENQKLDIYNYYDLNDQNLIKDVAKNLHSKKVFVEQMQIFVHLVADHIEKQTLAYIISLDSNYMKICKPIYMNIRINEKVENIATSESSTKKLKI